MADLYVNLNITSSGAAGTSGDPYGYDEWQSLLGADTWAATPSLTFWIQGQHSYNTTLGGTLLSDAILRAWGVPP